MKTTDPILSTPCGRTKNSRGKSYTTTAIRHHRMFCEDCIRVEDRATEEDLGVPEVLGMLDTSDMPDVAYFGLWNEMEG